MANRERVQGSFGLTTNLIALKLCYRLKLNELFVMGRVKFGYALLEVMIIRKLGFNDQLESESPVHEEDTESICRP